MILPDEKPNFNEETVEKIFSYFLGDNWKTKYPIVELAIRKPKVNFYDDELDLWTAKSGHSSFNWNTDPSAYIIKGQAKAILKKGLHFYTLSYHHKWDNKKRYVALRPATPGEEVAVWRMKNGQLFSSTAVAIDQHQGGSNSTWSEGCQTTHFSQYPKFIQKIGQALDYKVPLGVIKKPDAKLMKGLGKFPYILLDQNDYDYIKTLPKSDFGSEQDNTYRLKHFVNLLHFEKARPEEKEVKNGTDILNAIERQELLARNVPLEVPETEPVDEIEQHLEPESDKTVSNNTTEISAHSGDSDFVLKSGSLSSIQDSPFKQYLPDIDKLKGWFYKQITGNTLINLSAWYAGVPFWIKVVLMSILTIQVICLIGLVIYHRVYLFGLIQKAMELKADPTKNSPVLTTEMPTHDEQVPGQKDEDSAEEIKESSS